jgi:hypothetical protein
MVVAVPFVPKEHSPFLICIHSTAKERYTIIYLAMTKPILGVHVFIGKVSCQKYPL